MRSVRTATVTCGLALWAVLVLAPVVGVCMEGTCAVETGVKSAHCGAPVTVMLCCDEASDQPIDTATPNHRLHAGFAATRYQSVPTPRERPSRVLVVGLKGHSPPLYDLFASLLI